MVLNYRSIADMGTAILNNLYKFPHDVDLIVGIPRSGMLPANMLSLFLNKPYTDIDSFIEGRTLSCGDRGAFIRDSSSGNVLIVDDSIHAGGALKRAKEKLAAVSSNYNLKYAVVYATSLTKDMVDFYCEVIDGGRVFQWNLLHHKTYIPDSCFDIDGVLCPDPPVDDDGPLYLDYISNAPSLYIPSVKIGTLVSCRLEKYREVTESWLKNHGVVYDELIMLNLPDKAARLKWGKHGEYKGEVYKKSNKLLFVESSLAEATVIQKISHKPVFCTQTFEMLNGESLVDGTKTVLKSLVRRIRK